MRADVVAPVLIGLVLIYNQLIGASNHTLLAMLVMSAFVAAAMFYIIRQDAQLRDQQGDVLDKLEADGRPSGRIETSYPGQRTLPVAFPKKGFRFLRENADLVGIAQDLRFVRLFDQARYSDMLNLLDRLQKVYMYILAARYDPGSYIGTFMDLRDAVLEQLYSLVFVVPSTVTHIYGLNPSQVIKLNISRLTVVTRTMAEVLESYAEKTAGLAHVPDVVRTPAPHDTFDPMNRMRLP